MKKDGVQELLDNVVADIEVLADELEQYVKELYQLRGDLRKGNLTVPMAERYSKAMELKVLIESAK